MVGRTRPLGINARQWPERAYEQDFSNKTLSPTESLPLAIVGKVLCKRKLALSNKVIMFHLLQFMRKINRLHYVLKAPHSIRS